MSNDLTCTMTVNGWNLTLNGDEEPLVQDLHLAEHLGYERPRKIRDLIKRIDEKGEFRGICVRPTVVRTQMPTGGVRETTVDEYYLTEEQAALVAIAADTPKAAEVRRAMVRVWCAVRRGLFRPAQADTAQFAALQAAMAQLAAKVDSLSIDHARTLPRAELADHPEELRKARSLLRRVAEAERRFYNGKPCISKPHARLCTRFQLRSYRRLPWNMWAEAKSLLVDWIASPPDRVDVWVNPRQAKLFQHDAA